MGWINVDRRATSGCFDAKTFVILGAGNYCIEIISFSFVFFVNKSLEDVLDSHPRNNPTSLDHHLIQNKHFHSTNFYKKILKINSLNPQILELLKIYMFINFRSMKLVEIFAN